MTWESRPSKSPRLLHWGGTGFIQLVCQVYQAMIQRQERVKFRRRSWTYFSNSVLSKMAPECNACTSLTFLGTLQSVPSDMEGSGGGCLNLPPRTPPGYSKSGISVRVCETAKAYPTAKSNQFQSSWYAESQKAGPQTRHRLPIEQRQEKKY